MKVAVIGSRSFSTYEIMAKHLSTYAISEIVSGGARGADTLAEQYAACKNIPLKRFLPDWRRYGRAAGIRRNCDIINYADQVIAFWDGNSRGTKHSITYAQGQGKKIFIVRVGGKVLPEPIPKESYEHSKERGCNEYV
ncbi:DUF2493 domain-containing protein [Chitinivibrio alkaliphilus]|uniref:Putative GTP-binding protein n=1 Tax=Chitinivibrio alkaliphilus ACht1 TaxID=1313304 RepID=U7D753_9BACT|nr:SLOG family protein [Chitinivibrio alkaliphilus]ERP31391.1 putative GTP-binding protein [Chitinivibrio alkaliphilus ACht1]